MSEELYNIREDMKLAKAGTAVSRLFILVSIGLFLTSVLGYLPDEPLVTCALLCIGISGVITLIVAQHLKVIHEKIRCERWREEAKRAQRRIVS